MDLHAETHTFKTLMSLKKTLSVPRYQREFSWGNQELNEMFNDIVKRLIFNNETGELKTSEYFFGNIILQGDLTNNSIKEMSIIDGQQRLTAVTIFLASLSDIFKEEKETNLYDGARQYIIGKDDDNKEYPILVNKTPAPFFQYRIQGMNENASPVSEEEVKIENAYKFFTNKLKQNNLVKKIKDLYGLDIDYISALKLMRDQLLGSYVIVCWTANSEYVNLIFEIMNAKGLELASIDLIKNDIFALMDDVVPIDFASEEWKTINKNLFDRGVRIPFPTFFRHYWSSRYGKVSDKQLYKSFKKHIKTKEECKLLLLDMGEASKEYIQIVSPSLSDYENKNQYLHLVEMLKNLNDVFYVNMPRVFLLNLFEKYKSKIINTKLYEKTLKFIERFHFVYNAICSQRTNKLESTYCSFSNDLREAQSEDECKNVIEDFIKKLNNYLPSKDFFLENIQKLQYSAIDKKSSNILCKYFLQEIEKNASNLKTKRQDASVEHIVGENLGDTKTLLISRLVLLPREENSRIPVGTKPLEKSNFYSSSTYAYPKRLANEISKCTSESDLEIKLDSEFVLRAEEFYTKILN